MGACHFWEDLAIAVFVTTSQIFFFLAFIVPEISMFIRMNEHFQIDSDIDPDQEDVYL